MALVLVPRVIADFARAPARQVGRGKFHLSPRRDLPFETAAPARKFHEPTRPRRAHAQQFGIEKDRRGLFLVADLDGDALGRDLPVDFETAGVKRPEIGLIPRDAGVQRERESREGEGEEGALDHGMKERMSWKNTGEPKNQSA